MEAGRFARVGTRLSSREQLGAYVKWDLVVRDFFIFSNFVRQLTKINRMRIKTNI